MSDELRKYLLELAGHVRMAEEALLVAKAQLNLAMEKLAQQTGGGK